MCERCLKIGSKIHVHLFQTFAGGLGIGGGGGLRNGVLNSVRDFSNTNAGLPVQHSERKEGGKKKRRTDEREAASREEWR